MDLLTTNFVRKLQTGFVSSILSKMFELYTTYYYQTGWLLDALVRATPGAEGSFMSAGNIRGEKDFTGGQNFTLYNLVEVSPFASNFLVLVKLPGHVIESAVRESRAHAPESNGKHSNS